MYIVKTQVAVKEIVTVSVIVLVAEGSPMQGSTTKAWEPRCNYEDEAGKYDGVQ